MLKKHLFPLGLIFLLGLTPLYYFKDQLLIFGGDHGLWVLNSAAQIYRDFFVWNTRGIEEYQPYSSLLIPYLLILRFFELLQVPTFISEAILLSFLLMTAGFSMYFLINSLFGGSQKFLGITAAIFYMFNPYNLINWAIPHPVPLIAYAFYPLMLAFFVGGLHARGKPLKKAILFGLGSLILVTGNFAPSFLLITYLTIFLYFIFYCLFIGTKEERIRAFKFAALSGFFIFLLNIWWMVPLATLYQEGTSWFTTSVMSLEWSVQNYSKYSSFLHLFQLAGWPGWGTDTFGYDKTYVNNPLLVVLSFLPIILVVTSLLLLKSKSVTWIQREKKIFLFFALFYLLAMFLSKGIHPPFAALNWWLYKFVPLFAIFRTVFVKLGIMIALSLSVLFALSLTILYQRFKNKWLTAVIILLVLVYNYPFFTGKVILAKESFYNSSVHHKLPQYYLEATDWINYQPDDFKILPFPPQGNWEVYKWPDNERYIGANVLNELTLKTIKHAYIAGDLIKTNIYDLFLRRTTQNIDRLLGLLNVKYLLLNNDADPTIFGSLSSDYIQNQLASQNNIKLEKSFGQLDLYKLNDKYFLPHIYLAKASTYVIDKNFDLSKFSSFDDFEIQNEIYFANDIRIENKKAEILDRAGNIYLTAELIDPALSPQENFNEEIRFPYVRLTPDHILYSYILWKEQRAEKKAGKDFSALLDLKLLYASKRVVEAEKLLNKERLDFIEGTLKRYEEKINEIVIAVKEAERESELPSGVLAKIIAHLEKQKDFLWSLLHRLPADSQTRLQKSTEEIERAERSLVGKTSVNDKGYRQSIYKFMIPKAGRYTIYLERNNLKKYWQIEENRLNWELKSPSGEIMRIEADTERGDKNLILVDERELGEGVYNLYFDTFQANNLSPQESIKIGSNKEKSSFSSFKISNFDPRGIYKISFDYKNEGGTAPFFAIWQSEEEGFAPREVEEAIEASLDPRSSAAVSIARKRSEKDGVKIPRVILGPQGGLKKDLGWQHYKTIFKPNPRSDIAGIAFFAEKPEGSENGIIPDEEVLTINLYDNIKVERVFTNQIILKSRFPKSDLYLPDITFKKINPTKYMVRITGAIQPYTLVFSESFHPFWRAYVLEDAKKEGKNKVWETWFKKPLPEEKHLLVNGHANAWQIEKNGDYEIILEFWPQRLFYIGLMIAGLTLIFAISYLTYEKIKGLS